MYKITRISLLSAVGGAVFIADNTLVKNQAAWALTQVTADELEERKRAASIVGVINYLLDASGAEDDSYLTQENTELVVNALQGVLSNDEDIDSMASAVLVDDVLNGMLNLQADGSFTYLPNASFTGNDTFRYQVLTNNGVLTEAVVTIRVNGLPVAVDDDFQLVSNALFTGNVISNAVNGSDTIVDDAQVVAVINVATTLGGNVSIQTDGSFQYSPPANLGTQQDSFVYTLRDTDGDTDTATITWQIGPSVIGISQNSTVAENAELNAQLTLVTPTALEYVEFNGGRFTLSELNSASGTPLQVVNELYGALSITNFDAASGLLSYRYDPTGTAQDHSATLNDRLIEAVAINLKDTANANVHTATLVIAVTDTNPIANNDARSISEGTSAIAGNAVGIPGSATGDVQDSLVDVNATPVTDIDVVTLDGGATDGTVGTPLLGDYGDMRISSAGVYTYTLDNTNASVQGLKSGQSLQDVYTYTITDGDTDTATATISVTINGVEDALPTITSNSLLTITEGSASPLLGESRITATAGLNPQNAALIVTTEDSQQHSVTLAQLLDLSNNNIMITGTEGLLTLTGFNAGTGVLSFAYAPSGTGKDHSGGPNSVNDPFSLVVIDAEGDSSVALLLDMLITDSTLNTQDDTASIMEDDSPNQITGNNVLNNDSLGLDAPVTITKLVFDGQERLVGTEFATDYGLLTLQATGVYVYTLDNDNTAVQALNTNQNLTEEFIYTLSDTDGNTTGKLTITINGDTDAPTVTIANDNAGVASSDVSVVENLTVTSAFTVLAPGGLNVAAALKVTDENNNERLITAAELQALSATPVVIAGGSSGGQDGTLRLTAYNTGTGELTFEFDPTGTARDHSAGDTAIIESYTLVARDAEGTESSPVMLDILITDTNPIANNDARSILEGTSAIAGNAVGIAGSATGDVQDSLVDVNATPVTDIDVVTLNSGATDGTVGTPLLGEYGDMRISSAGVYTYTLDNTNASVQGLKQGQSLQDVYTYTITDGDTDTATATISVTINGVEDALPSIMFNGAANVLGQPDYTVSENSKRDLTATISADAGLSASDGLMVSNSNNVVRTISNSELFALSTSNIDSHIVIAGAAGTLTLNNYSGGVLGGTLSYHYAPTGVSTDHSAGDNSVVEAFTFTLKDAEADTNAAMLDILVSDTAPTAVADAASVTEDGNTIVSGDVIAGVVNGAAGGGADSIGADDLAATSVTIDGLQSALPIGFTATQYGMLDLNADGTYTYQLDNDHVMVQALNTGHELIETFMYTITDSDNDQSSATLQITINGTDEPPL